MAIDARSPHVPCRCESRGWVFTSGVPRVGQYSHFVKSGLRILTLLGVCLTTSVVQGDAPRVAWTEQFDKPLDWSDPFDHDAEELARVYSVKREDEVWFLRARHDASISDPPPAMHFGHGFQNAGIPLEKVKRLSWKWRARKHPRIADDPWQDMSAGVYVVIKTPSLFSGGKGFKFGWLAKPGPRGTYQRGLLQIELSHDPVTRQWRSESVDLCALFRQEYGRCEGEKLLYVGVVTDADGTRSVAEADYADFELTLR
jgi:hypothetical protein